MQIVVVCNGAGNEFKDGFLLKRSESLGLTVRRYNLSEAVSLWSMKYLMMCCLLACGLRAAGQASPKPNPGKISGIGKFQIGKTSLSVIAELEAELGVKTKRVYSSTEEASEAIVGSLVELMPDTVGAFGAPASSSPCRAVRVFLLPYYTIADIPLHELKLKFYNGVLADFQCNDASELRDALVLKYGEPVIKITQSQSSCTLQYIKESITKTSQTVSESWGTEATPAAYIIHKYYKQDCEQAILSFFSLYSASTAKSIRLCEDATTARQEKVKDAEKRKKLGGL